MLLPFCPPVLAPGVEQPVQQNLRNMKGLKIRVEGFSVICNAKLRGNNVSVTVSKPTNRTLMRKQPVERSNLQLLRLLCPCQLLLETGVPSAQEERGSVRIQPVLTSLLILLSLSRLQNSLSALLKLAYKRNKCSKSSSPSLTAPPFLGSQQ